MENHIINLDKATIIRSESDNISGSRTGSVDPGVDQWIKEAARIHRKAQVS